MPRRRTTRGAARTPLARETDVLICGASFAGLAVARQLAGSGARVLRRRPLRDRRAPDLRVRRADRVARGDGRRRLDPPDLRRAGRPHAARHDADGPPVHLLHLRLPRALRGAVRADRRRLRDGEDRWADGDGRPHRSRRPLAPTGRRRAGLEARPRAGRRRLPAARRAALARARGPSRRGLRGARDLDRPLLRPRRLRWSFPARDEVRVGVGSFDPRFHVKEPTVRLAEDLERDAVRYQGNWIPHKLRPAAVDSIFFAGDSAGHCLPLTAEGIRTAFYFGIACGAELRARRRRRGDPRRGAAPLRALLGVAPLEVRGDAAHPAPRPARPAAPARAGAARDEHRRLRDLVVRPLPRDRAAVIRARARRLRPPGRRAAAS